MGNCPSFPMVRSDYPKFSVLPGKIAGKTLKSIIYANVIDSIFLYGAPILSCGPGARAGLRRAEAIHRRACLRVLSGRPHLSYDAAYVLASIPPLALLADERSRLHQRHHEDARTEERQETLRRWQSQWDRSPKGRWTHRLIPNIRSWIERRHGEVDYHLTQLLSGHGYFKHHSQRYDHNASADCPACPLKVENAEHVFFNCPRFEEGREKLHRQLQEVARPENIVQLMLADKKTGSRYSSLYVYTRSHAHAVVLFYISCTAGLGDICDLFIKYMYSKIDVYQKGEAAQDFAALYVRYNNTCALPIRRFELAGKKCSVTAILHVQRQQQLCWHVMAHTHRPARLSFLALMQYNI
ncbi:unnamed protein product [Trichogramma brassicae]|uniref:Reverse transcriptase zinc-binding domain-containing protein n=1 Tax=Trichogramma brassicae TaxID=86971 RepID=A0A6H5IB85_9HYME|nr:unnamed protein product [Trichogramma brassicae]